MESLVDHNLLTTWLLNYGSIVLFFLLIAGIVAFPIPEETLLIVSGVFMSNGHLNIPSTMIAAYLGSICGITLSYYIGLTAGHYFIHKYGSWVGMTEARLVKAHVWFEKYGTWMLFFGYFIPGVRHFTGFTAGMTKLEFPRFALYAYTGAIAWVTLFLSLGYFFGGYWHHLYDELELGIEMLVLVPIPFAAIYLLKKSKVFSL